jgi:hypothetical protein
MGEALRRFPVGFECYAPVNDSNLVEVPTSEHNSH